jgi:hypothetical protein
VDIDELFDYPYSDVVSLDSLLGYLNSNSYTAVVAQMLDMFPEKPLSGQAGNLDEPLKEVHRFYDISNLRRKRIIEHSRCPPDNAYGSDDIAAFTGGIRLTIFGSNVSLTKHPLVFLNDKVRLGPGAHWHSNVRAADFTGVLFHYKFLDEHLHEQAVQAVEQRTSKSSAWYSKYLELVGETSSLSIKTDTSKELKSVNDLVGTQFVSISRQYMRFVENEEQRSGHYSEERRSERLFEAFFNARAEVGALAEQVGAMRQQNRILRQKYRRINDENSARSTGGLMMRTFYELLPANYQVRVRALARYFAIKVGSLQIKKREADNKVRASAESNYVRALERGFKRYKRYKKWEADSEIRTLAESAYAKPSAVSSNPLQAYFDSHIEGRGIWKWKHYFEIYHRHFAKFRGREVHVLEIGVFSGGSLEMWKHYFGPKCRIYGVDIQEACRSYEDDSVKIFIGDQSDPNFWTHFKKEVPFLDIVIDDGGHQFHQQRPTLDELLPHLRPGGVYLCEDLHGSKNKFGGYIGGLSRNLHAGEAKWVEANTAKGPTASHSIVPTPFQRAVHSVHLYPFLAVIEKTESPVSEFVAPMQGTQWQPEEFWNFLKG